MTLAPGVRLGAYEVVAPLGAGGMGEVYRARDTRLGREVALKVLPGAFALDPERLARFQQEARAAAALNHPNILALYDLGTHDGAPYLVSELLDGETLRERLQSGALPVRKAVECVVQIAHGLAAAHEKGIVHRDLKPENIFVTKDGRVKILDFGLAKLTQAEPALGGVSDLPTAPPKPPDTTPGTVLGTIGYMSPEQVRGLDADHRSDVFALGTILYELLAGKRAFHGTTTIDTMTAILKEDPPDLPSDLHVTPAITRILDRCLAKSPTARFQSAGDLAFALEALSSHSSATDHPPGITPRKVRRPVLMTGAAAVMMGALGFGIAAYLWRTPTESRTYRTFIVSPDGAVIGHPTAAAVLSLSPDGQRMAYTAYDSNGRRLLWIQELKTGATKPVLDTDGAGYMFWSPDSRFVAFTDRGFLKKVDIAGGASFTICPAPLGLDGTWGRSDDILFAAGISGTRVIWRVPASGGTPVAATKLDANAGDNRHVAPYFLPDGRHFLYLAAGSKANGPNDPRGLYVASLDASEPPKLLLSGGSNAKYAQGHLFFLRGTTLMVQPFDPDRLELGGTPTAIAENLDISGSQTRAVAAFSLSDNGLLAYLTSGSGLSGTARLLRFDRSGKLIDELDGANDYSDITLSPEGTRAAVALIGSTQTVRDVWIYDLRRHIRTRFTFGAQQNLSPIWSPDANRVVFSARSQGSLELHQRVSTGTGGDELLLADPAADLYPMSWSPDSRFILYVKAPLGSPPVGVGAGGGGTDLWVLPMNGDRKAFPFLQTQFAENSGQFSPDGRWLAYVSNESGRNEVYVVSFPQPSGKWQVSSAGGTLPRWRRDGKEIFFLAPDNRLMAAEVTTVSRFEIGTVQALFDVRPSRAAGTYLYDVSADGQRFLVASRPRDATLPPVTLVTNWMGLLKP
jgi:serine/threonine protein kinase/Tol biopolymer transport system component